MAPPGFDFTYWPLLGIYIPASLTAADVPAFFGEWERIAREQGSHVATFDMRDFNPMFASGTIRRAAAREVSRGMPAYRASLRGVARLVTHPLSRALLTAFDWMVPLPWPVLNTASTDDAEAWLRARARRVGLVLPERIDLEALRDRERLSAIERAS